MDRPRLIRGLRIAWSVWWGILCVLLVVLWVRSYWRTDYLELIIPGTEHWGVHGEGRVNGFQISSMHASLSIYHDKYMTISDFQDVWDGPEMKREVFKPPPRDFGSGFSFSMDRRQQHIAVPHLLPLLVLLAATLAPWLPWLSWKFSLRTLLIATTLIAVVLGLVVLIRH